MATDLEKAIQRVQETGGASRAEKRAIIQDLRKNANANGSLGAADRAAMNKALRATRPAPVATQPAPPPTTVPLPVPGEDTDGSNGRLTVPVVQMNVQPPGPPAEGYEWTKDALGQWRQTAIPGYNAPSGADKALERETAKVFLSDLLDRFGLKELAGDITKLIEEWGDNTNVIAVKLRENKAYKARFKGNLDRPQSGLNMLTEAEYLATEDAIATRMRIRGMGASFQSREYLAGLISRDVSAQEVDSRIEQAQRVVDNADPEIVNTMQRLYGASIGDLYGYVLDADTALGEIEKKVSAGITSRVAEQSGLQLGRNLSEQIGQMTSGNEQALRPAMQRAGALADSTRRLSALEGIDDITDEDVVEGEFGYNEENRNKVRKLQSQERARFSGRSGAFRGTLGGNDSY